MWCNFVGLFFRFDVFSSTQHVVSFHVQGQDGRITGLANSDLCARTQDPKPRRRMKIDTTVALQIERRTHAWFQTFVKFDVAKHFVEYRVHTRRTEFHGWTAQLAQHTARPTLISTSQFWVKKTLDVCAECVLTIANFRAFSLLLITQNKMFTIRSSFFSSTFFSIGWK